MFLFLFYSFLAGLATLLGAILVLSFGKPDEKILSGLLGFAAGIMLTVVIIDLIPSSYTYGSGLITVSGFLLGNMILFILDTFISWLPSVQTLVKTKTKGRFLKMGYLIAIAIALHDLPEGIAISVGYSAEIQLGIIIALAIGLHNIPEGMATAAPLLMGGMSNFMILFLISLVSLVTPLGASIGFVLVSISPSLIGLLLALAGGAMTYIVKKEIWPESYRNYPNYARLGALGGIFLMLIVSLIHH